MINDYFFMQMFHNFTLQLNKKISNQNEFLTDLVTKEST